MIVSEDNVLEHIREIGVYLDGLEMYFNELSNNQSIIDEELSDLYHYIENNKLDAKESYRMIKLIREKRVKRRKILKSIEIKRTYELQKNKLISDLVNRGIFKKEINMKLKSLDTQYRYRQIKEEDIKNILSL